MGEAVYCVRENNSRKQQCWRLMADGIEITSEDHTPVLFGYNDINKLRLENIFSTRRYRSVFHVKGKTYRISSHHCLGSSKGIDRAIADQSEAYGVFINALLVELEIRRPDFRVMTGSGYFYAFSAIGLVWVALCIFLLIGNFIAYQFHWPMLTMLRTGTLIAIVILFAKRWIKATPKRPTSWAIGNLPLWALPPV